MKSATELAPANGKPYLNDDATYRAARARLLAEEIELRGHLERVAQLRRERLLGSLVGDNYLALTHQICYR